MQSGPFRNMRYLDRACSSTLLPKLLGTYEDELHTVLKRLVASTRRTIVDIGCAEGYYAVGMALLIPDARVLAYDIDRDARAACRLLAETNGVAARVSIEERFEPAHMQRLDDPRPLVICDIDGGETELFAPSMSRFWQDADLIVELHDYLGEPCRQTVERCLADTHRLEIIASQNKSDAEHPELAYLTTAERRLAVDEILAPQHWLIAIAK